MPMEKTFSPAEAEARIAAMWEAANAFAAGANARPGADGAPAETFCIMIPPPNVTGSLHMGHAFNNTLQDILVRWHRMRGHDVLWQPGQDHAGIATQMVVERELAKRQQPSRREMGREAFVSKVWEWKAESGGTIVGQLKRLGCSLDWSRNAFTMSGAPGAPEGEGGNFHDAVIKVFVDLYDKGLIYRGKRLVNWDPHFETAISDLEVENIEVAGHMWHFKYPLAGGQTYEYVEKDAEGRVTLRETRDYISIATTRPETMLGDGAVAVHPSDERYAPIVGKLCEIPVGPKEHRRLIPIITDEYPDPNFGSGAVKITGAHDFNDYAVAERNHIPMYRLMDTKAAMRDDGMPYDQTAMLATKLGSSPINQHAIILSEAGFNINIADNLIPQIASAIDQINLVPDDLRGLDRFEARDRVVAQITAEGLAVMLPGADGEPVPYVEAKPIMQPFGDRSKTVIEPMLTDQWFVDTVRIVQPAIDAVRDGRTKIMPPSGEKTYFHWLENIEPWCISRQLWWGHQIPVWYGPKVAADGSSYLSEEGYEAFCAPSAQEALALARAHYGTSAHAYLSDLDSDEAFNPTLLVEMRAPGEQLKARLVRDPDVLDTWFSSGLWPIGTLGWPEPTPELKKYFPTDVLITGSDILFFWVARMMMMQLAVVGQVPFHTVYLHGLVRDAKGKKMSKSLGNVVDPLEIIDEFGADALRFTNAAMASLGGVLKLDTQRIAGYRNFGTKLWNATRFAEMNGVFDAPLGRPAPAHTVNRWIIGEVARTREAVDDALTNFRFNDAANTLYAFVWGKVCDWYVEFAKPLFDGDHAPETRQTMRWVLDQCFTLLHPMMPFITEDLWAMTGARAKMLVHGDWPEYGADLIDPQADREMNWVIQLIEEIRSARSQMGVPAGLKITMLTTEADDAARAALAHNEALILRLARLETITDGTTPRGAISLALPGAAFALPLAGIIDVAGEKARLSKAHDKLEKDLNGLRGRLGNPKFIASAPADIVEENRELLAAGEAEAQKLRAALARLADLG
jgi:valyl-tRNA synthetase